jgi:hypothetical protein
LRLLAYTQQDDGEIDRYRLMSIMKQPLPAEIFEWLDLHGACTSERPLRVPPNARLQFDARVAAPIRCQGHHLGWVWCTDRDQSMTDAELEQMGAFADEAAVMLYREMLLLDLDRSRERELLRDIVSDDEGIRREAAWQLSELALFTPDGRVAVLVIPLDVLDHDATPEGVRRPRRVGYVVARRRRGPSSHSRGWRRRS